MSIERKKNKIWWRQRVKDLFLLLNLLTFSLFIYSVPSFSWDFLVTLFVAIGFLTATIRLLYKIKDYRIKAISVLLFALACFLNLLLMVTSAGITYEISHAISNPLHQNPLLYLLILNLLFYGIDVSYSLFKSKKLAAYTVAFSLYLLILLGAELANQYTPILIPKFVLGICLFVPISELLIISIKTYRKSRKKFLKSVKSQNSLGDSNTVRSKAVNKNIKNKLSQ